jgi:DNA-binding CsgD family transcriptional regulator
MSLLNEEEDLLRVLEAFALCAEPVFAINDRRRIVFWNKAMERLLGYTYDDVVGRSCGDILAGNDTFGNRYCTDGCPIVSIAQRGDCVRHFSLAAHANHADARVRSLTTRENEILGLIAAGSNASVIGQHLGISPLTARNHIQHLFEKLEVHSKAEAASFAYRMGIV